MNTPAIASDSRPLLPCACRAALGLVLALVLVGCTPQPAPATDQEDGTPQSGGTLIMGSTVDVDSWNPYVSRQAFAAGMLRRILQPLAAEYPGVDDGPVFRPRLAESWSFSEDGTALTFNLREASWSDGQPIVADDVRFSWTAQTAEGVPWIDASRKARIRDVVVVDPRTVRFEFDGAYPGQLADAVEGLILPRHVYADVPFSEWATHSWTTIDVASGPFRLERHDPGNEVVIARNPAWGGEGPWVDGVTVRIVPDMANLVTQLRSGQVDYLEGLAPRDAATLIEVADIGLVPFDQPAYDYLGWNGARSPLSDPELRRALTLAIDREGLVEDFLYGFGRVSAGPLLSFWWAADPGVQPWPHDPEQARRILAGHGYRPAADGGEPLKLSLLSNHANALHKQIVVKVQHDLGQVGVEVELAPMEMRAMRQRIAAGDFDGYLGGWIYTVNDLSSVFHSSARFPQGANLVGYDSAEADAALDRAGEAADRAAMAEALAAFQRRVHEDQPYTFLYEKQRLAAHGPRVHGLQIESPLDSLAALESLWLH